MLYQLNKDEVRHLRETFLPHFKGAEMLIATFRTDPRVIDEVLPAPLDPAPQPLATAFVARYPETNFGSVYNEGALFVHALHRGLPGLYCLAMPVDDDMALIGGREVYGYPKKMATITLDRNDDEVVGRVVRKGVEIMRLSCKLNRTIGLDNLAEFYPTAVDEFGESCLHVPAYLFKHSFSADTKGFDYIPRLVRQVNVFRPRHGIQSGEAELVLSSSPMDPLGEIPVREMLFCSYGTWDNTMLPGRVVGRAWNIWNFLRYAFFKIDVAAYRLGWQLPDRPEAGGRRPQAGGRRPQAR